jgi:parallel beta-helix repeat protein
MGGAVAWGSLLATSGLAMTDNLAADEVAGNTAIAQSDRSQDYTVVHVNAQEGSDIGGDGSQLRPYQTITHALELANTSTLILLTGGVYSTESGETFPLVLRPGVTVQGTTGHNARDVVIRGNGNYYSEAHGLRDITILGTSNAGLANVIVSNPHPEGVGLWIESGSPIILNNTFLQNGSSGIYIAGRGNPVIRGNYFLENGQAGLVIAGPSAAEVEANVFENTGTGITVAPDATPNILNNRISRNLDGLIIHAAARPTLGNNEISQNRRNSIIDYAAWSDVPANPAVRTTQPPPPTVDREASETGETVVPAVEPSAERAAASVIATQPNPPSAQAQTSAATRQPDEPSTISEPSVIPELPSVAPSTVPLPMPQANAASEASTPAAEPEAIAAVSAEPADMRPATAPLGTDLADEITHTVTALSAVDISFTPPIPSQASLQTLDLMPVVSAADAAALNLPEEPATEAPPAPGDHASESSDETALALEPQAESRDRADALSSNTATPEPISIPVIPPPADAVTTPDDSAPADTPSPTTADETATTEDLPETPPPISSRSSESRALQVPNGDIPMGASGELPNLAVTGAAIGAATEGPPPPPSLAASLGLSYKVLVAATDQAAQDQVRTLVEDAFRTRFNGRLYMQVGAYPTFEEAQAQAERLNQLGLQAQIEQVP